MPDRLTEEQVEAMKALALKTGAERREAWGRDFHEDDFFAGVMVAFFATETQEKIPPMWILGLMAGRSPVEAYLKENAAEAEQGEGAQ